MIEAKQWGCYPPFRLKSRISDLLIPERGKKKSSQRKMKYSKGVKNFTLNDFSFYCFCDVLVTKI